MPAHSSPPTLATPPATSVARGAAKAIYSLHNATRTLTVSQTRHPCVLQSASLSVCPSVRRAALSTILLPLVKTIWQPHLRMLQIGDTSPLPHIAAFFRSPSGIHSPVHQAFWSNAYEMQCQANQDRQCQVQQCPTAATATWPAKSRDLCQAPQVRPLASCAATHLKTHHVALESVQQHC